VTRTAPGSLAREAPRGRSRRARGRGRWRSRLLPGCSRPRRGVCRLVEPGAIAGGGDERRGSPRGHSAWSPGGDAARRARPKRPSESRATDARKPLPAAPARPRGRTRGCRRPPSRPRPPRTARRRRSAACASRPRGGRARRRATVISAAPPVAAPAARGAGACRGARPTTTICSRARAPGTSPDEVLGTRFSPVEIVAPLGHRQTGRLELRARSRWRPRAATCGSGLCSPDSRSPIAR
jgi:hypothetical protein